MEGVEVLQRAGELQHKKAEIKIELHRIEEQESELDAKIKQELKELRRARKEREQYLTFFRMVIPQEELVKRVKEIEELRKREKEHESLYRKIRAL